MDLKALRFLGPVLAVAVFLALLGAPPFWVRALTSPPSDGSGYSGGGGEGSDGVPDDEAVPALTGARTVDGAEAAVEGGIASVLPDESAALVKNGGVLTLTNAVVTKTGDTTNAEASGAHGLNAAIAAESGGAVRLAGGAVTAAGTGASAVFVTGEGSKAEVDGADIRTAGESAHGLAATYGGAIEARGVSVATEGKGSAAVEAGRGAGTVSIDGASLSASGEGGPLIRAAGTFSGADVHGTAADGQMLVLEGGSAELSGSDLTGAGSSGILFYTNAARGTAQAEAAFRASDSSLTSTADGAFLLVTNARARATFSGCTLTFSSGLLAQVSANMLNGWGTPGENGGELTLTGVGQVLAGDVSVDKISAFSLELTDGSIYTGAVDTSGVGGSVSVSLDEASSWTLTADSHVDALTNAVADLSNIQSGGFMLYYDAENPGCAWLNGMTYPLPGGGMLAPEP